MNIQNIFEIFIVASNNANNNKNFRHGEYYILKNEKQSIQVFENKKILLRFLKTTMKIFTSKNIDIFLKKLL